ncbi:MAG: hypothetical protein WAS21_05740 [Geminicoccaceae bacterium]
MTETMSLELIGRTVLETRDAVRGLAGVPEALRQLQDDQTVMIGMLHAHEAALDLMRWRKQHYAGLRARLAKFERCLKMLEAAK